ncbi:MAG: BON domain-containing protein [Acidobacteria bacterium]|nr:BON domain-containing protein [Acidobacteriota bacterium]
MKRKIALSGVAFVLTVLVAYNPAMAAKKLTSHKHAAASTAKVDNATLVKNVEARLARTRSLKTLAIHVQATSGVVTLSGTVPKWWQKGVATRETRMVTGVKKVDNELKIAPGGMRKQTKHARKAAEKSS